MQRRVFAASAVPAALVPHKPRECIRLVAHAPDWIWQRLGDLCSAARNTANSADAVLALPSPSAETYTAHFCAITAVQSNEVYLTPCTAVPSLPFGLGVR